MARHILTAQIVIESSMPRKSVEDHVDNLLKSNFERATVAYGGVLEEETRNSDETRSPSSGDSRAIIHIVHPESKTSSICGKSFYSMLLEGDGLMTIGTKIPIALRTEVHPCHDCIRTMLGDVPPQEISAQCHRLYTHGENPEVESMSSYILGLFALD